YRSTTGAYDASVKSNSSDTRYVDALSGTVEINTSVATIMGSIYGNVYTNGGNVTKNTSSISGIIDNNVPFSLPPYYMPDTSAWSYVSNPSTVGGNTTISPLAAGSPQSPNYYLISSYSTNGNLSVNAFSNNGTPQETYVAVKVNGDVGSSSGQGASITIANHVHLELYFTGNFGAKATNIVNNSGFAGNLQIYGISPSDPSVQQQINLNSCGDSTAGFVAVFYAPFANFTINGGPDIVGSIVC